MKNISKNIFKGREEIKFIAESGAEFLGHGIISKLKEKPNDFSAQIRHELGNMTSPLYIYFGDCSELAEESGGELFCADERFRVLSAEWITENRVSLFVRAILERVV